MAVKQFPQDFSVGAAVKLLGATADGSMVYIVVPAGGDTLQSVLARGAVGTTEANFNGGIGINTAIKFPNLYKFQARSSVNNNLLIGTQGGELSLEIVNDDVNAPRPLRIYSAKTSINVDGGNVSVGSAADNGQKFQVYGNITASGSITPGSDKRLKKYIKTIPKALELILELRPVSYTLREDSATALGFIADEVREIFPELILEGKDEDKMLSMNYMGLTAPIVKAIQEQQSIIEALTKRIEALEAK